MHRRQMLRSLALGGLAGGLFTPLTGCDARIEGDSPDAYIHQRLLALFPGKSRRAAVHMGHRALEKLGPLRADLRALYLAVFDGDAWHASSGDDAWRLARMVEADFAAGRVTRVDGWVISFTEMYTAAALALAVREFGGVEDAGEDVERPSRPSKRRSPMVKPSAERGRSVYATHCRSCHQDDGGGLGGQTAPDIRARLSESSTKLRKVVMEGRSSDEGTMPSFDEILTEQEVADVVAYAKTL